MKVTLTSYKVIAGKMQQAADSVKEIFNADDEMTGTILGNLLMDNEIEVENFSVLKHTAALYRFMGAGGRANIVTQ